MGWILLVVSIIVIFISVSLALINMIVGMRTDSDFKDLMTRHLISMLGFALGLFLGAISIVLLFQHYVSALINVF